MDVLGAEICENNHWVLLRVDSWMKQTAVSSDHDRILTVNSIKADEPAEHGTSSSHVIPAAIAPVKGRRVLGLSHSCER